MNNNWVQSTQCFSRTTAQTIKKTQMQRNSYAKQN